MFCLEYHLDLKYCESLLAETVPQLVLDEPQSSGKCFLIIIIGIIWHLCPSERNLMLSTRFKIAVGIGTVGTSESGRIKHITFV